MYLSDDIVIRKDESLSVILERIDAQLGRIESVQSEQQKQLDLLSRRLDSVEAQMSLLTHLLYWGIGFISLLIVVAPAVWALLQKITRPAFTLEDVRKIVSEEGRADGSQSSPKP